MSALKLHPTDSTSVDLAPEARMLAPAALLLDISALAALLSRSVPSLRRDDAAGRLPSALRLGGSKRWRADEIKRWVEAGCPSREKWVAINQNINRK
ncbi:MAG: hypothetical protein K8T89_22090 [Planctomycetes bacterium]|nr:hypothetical protein [Planctomycetota bacterium]